MEIWRTRFSHFKHGHTKGTFEREIMGTESVLITIVVGLLIGIFSFTQLAIAEQTLSSVKPSAEFYKIAGEQCREGVESVCIALLGFCEYLRDSRACFRFACAMGLRGYDEIGLKYLRISCEGGWDEACDYIPTVNEYLKELRDVTKVVI